MLRNLLRFSTIFLLIMLLPACGRRALRLDFVPVEDELKPQMVEKSPAIFVTDKIALININGMISSSKSTSLLSSGVNKVSDLRETLNAIELDPTVKAVVLRINSPGGTVTASDMMYRDLMAFKKRTGKPVITCMLDLCASGGYYVSCASDYRIAYPTSITGSIGVIIQTINFTGTMGKLGISAKAFTSGPNKDVLSPLRPLNDNDKVIAEKLVMEFYGDFVKIVKAAPNHVKASDWEMLTDGRIVTGKEAAQYGLIDQVGDINDAIAKAKELAKIKNANIIQYTREGEFKGSVYANTPAPAPQINMVNINADFSEIQASTHPQFLYLWTGQ